MQKDWERGKKHIVLGNKTAAGVDRTKCGRQRHWWARVSRGQVTKGLKGPARKTDFIPVRKQEWQNLTLCKTDVAPVHKMDWTETREEVRNQSDTVSIVKARDHGVGSSRMGKEVSSRTHFLFGDQSHRSYNRMKRRHQGWHLEQLYCDTDTTKTERKQEIATKSSFLSIFIIKWNF